MAISAASLVVEFRATGAREVSGAIDQIDGKVKQATGGFDAFFDSIQGGAGNALRALDGISRVMGSLAVMGGVTLIAGGARAAWQQVDAVQQATIALRAYEQDARAVDDVLNDLLRFARSDAGRLFMRQELFHAAQVMKVAGAETQNLSRYVQIMSRAVSTGMTTFNDLERVLARVVSTGRLTTIEFELLQQAGFQLDESLRNTTVTAEELFDALDRGSVEVAGQTETIQGRMMQLQTAIRGVGLAFLDVDSETSMFREGGLGARIMEGLEAAPDALRNVADAARGLGEAIVGVIDFIANMVNWFRMWPDSIQGVVTSILKLVAAFGALRVAGQAVGMVGGLMGLGPIMGGVRTLMGGGLLRDGAAGATSLGSSLAMLVGRINPVGIAITGLIAVGGLLVNSFMNNKAATEAWESSLMSLDDTLERLRRRGDSALADQVDSVRGMFQDIAEIQPDFEAFVGESIKRDYGIEAYSGWIQGLWTMPEGYARGLQDDFVHVRAVIGELNEIFSEGSEEMTKFNRVMNDILTDPLIDVDAWLTDLITLLNTTPEGDLADEFRKFLEIPPSEWSRAADGLDNLGESMEKVIATAEQIDEIFSGLPTQLDDLRISGMGRQASDLERLTEAVHDYFRISVGPGPLEPGAAGYVEDMRQMNEITEESEEILDTSWQRINQAIASGDYDNARLMADVMAVIMDPDLDPDQTVAAISEISNSLNEYKNLARDVLAVLGQSDLTSMLNLAGIGGEAVEAAANVNQLAASLDTLFRVIVGNTNAIASQMESLFKWADELIAEEGVWSKLDDLLDAGRITGKHGEFTGDSDYARAQQAYNQIAEANLRIQEHVLTIQAKQAPLLAANAVALEEYMAQIAEWGGAEQLAALGFMDSALQEQLGTVVNLAGQFKQMEGGADAFYVMAEGIQHTNPALFAMMETMGLIRAERDEITGEVLSFEVNLDGATTVQDTLNNLIESIDALTLALGGIPPVRVDTSEVDPAIAKLDKLAAAAGSVVSAAMGKLSSGGRDAGPGTWGDTGVPVVTGLPEAGTGGTVTLDVVDNVSPVLDDLSVRLYGFDGLISTVTLEADATQANSTLDSLGERTSAYNQLTSTATLAADASGANAVLDTLAERLNGFNGAVYTATLNVGVGFSGFNIPGFADGGVVNSPLALVGERGPELVSLPRGSYVHTNAETMRMMNSKSGGKTQGHTDNSIHISFEGATFGSTNREEMNRWAEEELVPRIERAASDKRVGMGAA